MSNNIYLNTKKSLSVQVNGSYATKAIQGIYDIKPMYNLSAGVVWSINERLIISILDNDLLNGQKGRTSTKINSVIPKESLGRWKLELVEYLHIEKSIQINLLY